MLGPSRRVARRTARRTTRRVNRRQDNMSGQPEPEYYDEPAPTAPAESDYMDELAQLSQLKDQGVITEEEFQAKKKQILGL